MLRKARDRVFNKSIKYKKYKGCRFVVIYSDIIPLRFEFLHYVQEFVVYSRVISEPYFDLVQVWEGIFHLGREKKESVKESVSYNLY